MPDKQVVYTDRSRTITYNQCHYKRYLAYHHTGTGIQRDNIILPLVVGSAVHAGLEYLLKPFIVTDILSAITDLDIHSPGYQSHVNLACKAASDNYNAAIASSPFDLSDFIESATVALEGNDAKPVAKDDGDFSFLPDVNNQVNQSEYISYLAHEQLALVEALVATFAYAPNGMRFLLSEYEILEVEQEDEFVMVESAVPNFELRWMSKADGLLRRRLDGSLVVLSFKTAATYDGRKSVANASDMQGMSEVVAVEKRLQEWGELFSKFRDKQLNSMEIWTPETAAKDMGIPEWFIDAPTARIEGVQMMFLLKGTQRSDSLKLKRQESPLIRPWVKASDGLSENADYRFKYSWTDTTTGQTRKLGKDYTRVNIWETLAAMNVTMADYIYIIESSAAEKGEPSPLDSFLVNPELYQRDVVFMERWLRQTTRQEFLNALVTSQNPINPHDIDERFDLTGSSTGACSYPSRCTFYQVCWGPHYNFDDPLNSGFKPRVPHHLPELVQLQGLSNG